MKKIIFICLLFIAVIIAFVMPVFRNDEPRVLDQSRLSQLRDIQNYVTQLQNEKAEYKGYKVFTVSEGKKAVVISSGEEGLALKLADVLRSSKVTAITIEKGIEESKEKNPYIVVEIDKIVGAFYVWDQNRKEYEGTGYYK